jgi:hypothetical protein
MPLCDHCGDIVAEHRIGIVWTEYPTETFAGTMQEWCQQCRQSDERDDVYDTTARKHWERQHGR